MTFWKRKTDIVTVIISVTARDKGEKGMNRQNIGKFDGSEMLYDTIIMDTCYYTLF